MKVSGGVSEIQNSESQAVHLLQAELEVSDLIATPLTAVVIHSVGI